MVNGVAAASDEHLQAGSLTPVRADGVPRLATAKTGNAQGAGVEIEHQLGATNQSLLVDGCTFESNLAGATDLRTAAGSTWRAPSICGGGGADGADGFTNNTLSAGAGAVTPGCRREAEYQESARVASVRHELIECAFESNRALLRAAGGGGRQAAGAGDWRPGDRGLRDAHRRLDLQGQRGGRRSACRGGTFVGGGLCVDIGNTGITRAASGVHLVRTSRFSRACGDYGAGGRRIRGHGGRAWLTLLEQCVRRQLPHSCRQPGGAIGTKPTTPSAPRLQSWMHHHNNRAHREAGSGRSRCVSVCTCVG